MIPTFTNNQLTFNSEWAIEHLENGHLKMRFLSKVQVPSHRSLVTSTSFASMASLKLGKWYGRKSKTWPKVLRIPGLSGLWCLPVFSLFMSCALLGIPLISWDTHHTSSYQVVSSMFLLLLDSWIPSLSEELYKKIGKEDAFSASWVSWTITKKIFDKVDIAICIESHEGKGTNSTRPKVIWSQGAFGIDEGDGQCGRTDWVVIGGKREALQWGWSCKA